ARWDWPWGASLTLFLQQATGARSPDPGAHVGEGAAEIVAQAQVAAEIGGRLSQLHLAPVGAGGLGDLRLQLRHAPAPTPGGRRDGRGPGPARPGERRD